MEMNRIDEEYEAKMVAFEVDCNGGKGERMACHHVGEFYSVVKDQHDRSAKIYIQNCTENKYGPSCFNLARLYLAGKGVAQDDTKAEEYFGKACEEQHLQACHHKAVMLYSAMNFENATSQEKEAKKQEALKLLDWSCKEGEYESCYHAASHYLNPERSDRNPPMAIDYLEKACHRNHAPSCFNLAVMYRTGDKDVPKNPALFEKYKDMTNKLVKQSGSLSGKKAA